MSFMLGAASYGVAIVASEGRVSNIGFPKRVIREDHLNVHRLRTGWVTGSVTQPPLEQMYEAITPLAAEDLEAIATRVHAIATEFAAAYGDVIPRSVEDCSWGRLFVVGADPDGCHRVQQVNTTGEILTGDWLRLIVPPELWDGDGPGARVTAAYLEAQKEFERTWWPVQRRPLALRIRAIAQLYQRVWELVGPNGSVNDRVELGILRGEVVDNIWVSIYEYLPPTPASELLAAPDDALLALLQPASLEPVDANR